MRKLNRKRALLVALAAVVAVGAATVVVAVTGASGDTAAAPLAVSLRPGTVAWQLNQVQLDPGICGTNLQLGGDKTASSSATPTFLLYGDGAAGRYSVEIDGDQVGTFATDNFGNTCITTTRTLTDGRHTLTAQELAPVPTNQVQPFDFSVDTVPPAAPSTPTMVPFADTGVPGDNISRFQNNGFTGTSDPNTAIQLYGNNFGIGGATSDTTGKWFVATSTLNDGVYQVRAVAIDTAGNRSASSGSVQVEIDATPPAVTVTPVSGTVVSGTVNVASMTVDAHSIIRTVFSIDGAQAQAGTGTSYQWNTSQAGNGPHTVKVDATDVAGNVGTSTVTLQVANGVTGLPGKPTITSLTASDATVTVNWSAPPSDGGSPVTGYLVLRSTQSGAETQVGQVDASQRSFADHSLSNGTTYYYKVAATNANGTGAASDEASAAPQAPASVPAAPKGFPKSVVLLWSAPASGGSPITGYRIYRRVGAGAPVLVGQVTAAETGFVDPQSPPGAIYTVTAVNAQGESLPSPDF